MKTTYQSLLLMGVLLFNSACSIATHPTSNLHSHSYKAPAVYQTGKASWYGKAFHGKRTSSGTRFNENELTAAHKTLPFNTIVQVTNLSNNKKVTVKITDRGPFIKGRIIDLSRAAAKYLDIIDKGTSNVQLTIITRG